MIPSRGEKSRRWFHFATQFGYFSANFKKFLPPSLHPNQRRRLNRFAFIRIHSRFKFSSVPAGNFMRVRL